MYKIENKGLYYVFPRNDRSFIFKNYKKLLWWAKSRISNIGNNWNDTYSHIERWGEIPKRYLIEYIITDEFFRIINTEQLKKDIKNLKEEKRNYHTSRISSKKWEFFRNSPVPYTFRWKGGPGQKPPRIKSIYLEQIDYPEYTRSKRGKKYLPYYGTYRDRNDKCWKRNKIKKQWQKGKK